MSILY